MHKKQTVNTAVCFILCYIYFAYKILTLQNICIWYIWNIKIKDRSGSLYLKKHTISNMNPYFKKGGSDMKRITKEEAARLIDSGMTVAFGGIGSYGAPETMLQAIADRYDAEQMPKDLSIAGTLSPGN